MPQQTPYIYSSTDYAGKMISMTFNFSNLTRLLLSARLDRDSDCMYHTIYLGVGPDGTPNTSQYQWTTSQSLLDILLIDLTNLNLLTIEDVLAMQITAGP